MARISTIAFDRHEQPIRATILTRLGAVKVIWRDVCGDRCWFTSGVLDAKKLAVPAVERIEAHDHKVVTLFYTKPAAGLSLTAKKRKESMIAFLDHQAPPATKRPRPNLLLHCGARAVKRNEVQLVPTPRATDTWTPIPHLELVTQVERTLQSNRLIVGTQAHSLSHDGARYFGLMEIQRTESDEDYCWVLGLRNSHDKTFPAGIIAGSSVFICDNLAFSGEVKLARKHTRFITRDLPRLVQSAVGKLMDRWHHQDARIDTYKLTDVEDRTAHDLVVRATDVGVCPNKLIPRVLHEWREPRHEAFAPRNAWSLFNAFTEALKGNLIELPRRTEALHGLLDTHVGLDIPSLN